MIRHNSNLAIFLLIAALLATTFQVWIAGNNPNRYLHDDALITHGLTLAYQNSGEIAALTASTEDLSDQYRAPNAMWPPGPVFLHSLSYKISGSPDGAWLIETGISALIYYLSFAGMIYLFAGFIPLWGIIWMVLSWLALPGLFLEFAGPADQFAAACFQAAILWIFTIHHYPRSIIPAILAGFFLGLCFWMRYAYWIFMLLPLILYLVPDIFKRRSVDIVALISAASLLIVMYWQISHTGSFTQLDEGTHNPSSGFFPENWLKPYPFPLIIFGQKISLEIFSNPVFLIVLGIESLLLLYAILRQYSRKVESDTSAKSLKLITGIVLTLSIFPLYLLSLRYRAEYNGFTYISEIRYYILLIPLISILILSAPIKELLQKALAVMLFLHLGIAGFHHLKNVLTTEDQASWIDETDPVFSKLNELSNTKDLLVLKSDMFAWDPRFYAMDIPIVDVSSNNDIQTIEPQSSKPLTIIFTKGENDPMPVKFQDGTEFLGASENIRFPERGRLEYYILSITPARN